MSRVRDLLQSHRHHQIPREYSGSEVYYLPDLAAYLKIGQTGGLSNIGWEGEVLRWLEGKMSVPTVLDTDTSDDRDYLLISEIAGEPYSERAVVSGSLTAAESMIEAVSREVRRLHDLPFAGCKLDQRLETKLKRAGENIRAGVVDETDFDIENLGKPADQILEELLSARPTDEDLVFTHGDLCLPNIIIADGGVSGLIDFERGGVGDRYQDIALFLRSFRFNCSHPVEVEAAFCRGYGLDTLDQPKIDFYRKLDELF